MRKKVPCYSFLYSNILNAKSNRFKDFVDQLGWYYEVLTSMVCSPIFFRISKIKVGNCMMTLSNNIKLLSKTEENNKKSDA